MSCRLKSRAAAAAILQEDKDVRCWRGGTTSKEQTGHQESCTRWSEDVCSCRICQLEGDNSQHPVILKFTCFTQPLLQDFLMILLNLKTNLYFYILYCFGFLKWRVYSEQEWVKEEKGLVASGLVASYLKFSDPWEENMCSCYYCWGASRNCKCRNNNNNNSKYRSFYCLPGIILWALHRVTESSPPPHEVRTIPVPILCPNKLKPRKVKCGSGNSNPGSGLNDSTWLLLMYCFKTKPKSSLDLFTRRVTLHTVRRGRAYTVHCIDSAATPQGLHYAVHPWATWVWTAMVHLDADVFSVNT